jgi:hypothetical protein
MLIRGDQSEEIVSLRRFNSALLALVETVADWKVRDDGLVYSDEPLDGYIVQARALVAQAKEKTNGT